MRFRPRRGVHRRPGAPVAAASPPPTADDDDAAHPAQHRSRGAAADAATPTSGAASARPTFRVRRLPSAAFAARAAAEALDATRRVAMTGRPAGATRALRHRVRDAAADRVHDGRATTSRRASPFDHGVDVATAVSVRSTITALVVAALLVVQRVPLRADAAPSTRAAAIGLLVGVQSLCLYSAVARLPVALALLAFNTYPLWTALWAASPLRESARAPRRPARCR